MRNQKSQCYKEYEKVKVKVKYINYDIHNLINQEYFTF